MVYDASRHSILTLGDVRDQLGSEPNRIYTSSLKPSKRHSVNLNMAALPTLAPSIQLRGANHNTDNPFDFSAVMPPSAPTGSITSWWPSAPEAPVPRSLDMLFPCAYFDSVRTAPPSLTMMRRFNEKVARLRKRGLAPEWMPNQKFSPADMPHLLALAFSQGASGGLDLADVMSDMPKLLTKLGQAAINAGDTMEKAEGDAGILKAIVLVAATTMMGVHHLPYSPFFFLIQSPATNNHESVVFLFNWISEGLGEQTIQREALRASRRSDADPDNASDALHFLYPQLNRVLEEAEASWQAIVKQAFAVEASNKADGVDVSANALIEGHSPLPPALEARAITSAKWVPPVTPDGVILSGRAIREIRRERRYAQDRLVDGLKVLGLYRSMRLGHISFEDYRAAVRLEHFEDAPCFADSGSLKAFGTDYSVIEGSRKYVLDRHLKWGKGNNAVSAVRIYYAWDEGARRVIVGSAPRHLPIWAHS